MKKKNRKKNVFVVYNKTLINSYLALKKKTHHPLFARAGRWLERPLLFSQHPQRPMPPLLQTHPLEPPAMPVPFHARRGGGTDNHSSSVSQSRDDDTVDTALLSCACLHKRGNLLSMAQRRMPRVEGGVEGGGGVLTFSCLRY